MGTDVRTLPDRIAAVSVGVLWGRKHRDRRPEQLPVTEVGVVIADVAPEGIAIARREIRSGSELASAPEWLLELELPLVLYNGLRFDWVALDSLTPAGALVARTIDVYSALLNQTSEIVGAEGDQSAFPMRGEYGVLHPHRVAETNLGYLPGAGEGPLGEAELAAELWHCFATSGRAILAGRSCVLRDTELATLRGQAAIADEAAWRQMLAERPAPAPYRRKTRHPVTFPRVDQRYV